MNKSIKTTFQAVSFSVVFSSTCWLWIGVWKASAVFDWNRQHKRCHPISPNSGLCWLLIPSWFQHTRLYTFFFSTIIHVYVKNKRTCTQTHTVHIFQSVGKICWFSFLTRFPKYENRQEENKQRRRSETWSLREDETMTCRMWSETWWGVFLSVFMLNWF